MRPVGWEPFRRCSRRRLDDGVVRVLVAARESPVASHVQRALVAEGFFVDVASVGEVTAVARRAEHAAVVLDSALGATDSRGTCERLRASGVGLPIVALSASLDAADRVALLDAGADDCVAVPCSFRELAARLRALTRRRQRIGPPVLEADDLRLDPATREVSRAGVPLRLSPKEFSVLELFMRRPGEAISRFYLLEHVWGAADVRSNTIDALMVQLRRKVEEPFGRDVFETVRGIGYRLAAPADGTRTAVAVSDAPPGPLSGGCSLPGLRPSPRERG